MGISVDPELFDDDTVVQWGKKNEIPRFKPPLLSRRKPSSERGKNNLLPTWVQKQE
jgi:hypothetical protein